MLLRAERLFDLFRHPAAAPRIPADRADRRAFGPEEPDGKEQEDEQTRHGVKMQGEYGVSSMDYGRGGDARGRGCECAKVQMRLGRVQMCKGGGSRFRWRDMKCKSANRSEAPVQMCKGEPETGWLAGGYISQVTGDGRGLREFRRQPFGSRPQDPDGRWPKC